VRCEDRDAPSISRRRVHISSLLHRIPPVPRRSAWLVHILLHWSEGDEAAQQQRSFQLIMAIINISVIIGFSFVPFIDWAAHVFGLLGGASAQWEVKGRARAWGGRSSTCGAPHPLTPRSPVYRLAGIAMGLWLFGGALKKPAQRWGAQLLGAAGYCAMLGAGLAIIFTTLQPSTDLLAYCHDVVQPSYPQYDLTCYSP
jgi:hypothetical protein